MKRSPLPPRRKPLARSTKPIPKRSKSPVRAERLRLYEDARGEARQELCWKQGIRSWDEPRCEWPECRSEGTDCHHTHGRAGSNLYDKTKLRFLCRRHHQQAHHDPKAARALGLIA